MQMENKKEVGFEGSEDYTFPIDEDGNRVASELIEIN